SQNYKIKRNFFADIYAIIDAVGFGYGQAVVSKHLVKKNKLIKEKKYNKKMISPIFLSYYHRSYIPKVHSKVIEALSHHVKQFL
uniref:hypothetical protein n=1 Tax=Halobacteriovorax sp. TaxID=2020862 RepID=UPI00356A2093